MQLDKLKSRDRLAQHEFRRHHYPWILGTCQRLLRDEHLAKDCAEDILTDFLYRYVDGLENQQAISAYLRMMTMRRCVRLRSFRDRHHSIDELPLKDQSPATGADEQLDQRRRLARLALCLEKLTRKAQSLLRLYYFHEQKMEDIAGSLGTSRQYVGRLIGKGLAQLKKCLKEKP